MNIKRELVECINSNVGVKRSLKCLKTGCFLYIVWFS